MSKPDMTLKERFSPESQFGGFSRNDAAIEFYSRIGALVEPDHEILDFGAGRGAQVAEDPHAFRRELKIFKGRCKHVEGCDVDGAVSENPYIDKAQLIAPDEPLPYADDRFDLIFSSWVFEHIDHPETMARELLRIVKPGGYICAMTPNRFGYIALAAQLIANKAHVKLLRKIQPERKEVDVFPTRYKLNSRGDLKKHFGEGCLIYSYGVSGDPAYTFNKPILYRVFMALHRLTPSSLQPILLIFIRKPV